MSYFNSTLLPLQGAHPVSTNAIYLTGADDACTLHLFYTLPPLLFVDTHELAQRDASYTFEHWGTRDVERPVHALPDSESQLLVNVNANVGGSKTGEENVVRVEVPMHLRYGKPRAPLPSEADSKPYAQLTVQWPQVFLRCPKGTTPSSTSSPLSLPPHVSSALSGSLVAIPPHASFAHAPEHTLVLPLGNPQDLAIVEPLTALTILLSFFWLLRVSWKVSKRIHGPTSRPKTA